MNTTFSTGQQVQYRTATAPIAAAATKRNAQGGELRVQGYAALFNEFTDLGQFVEVITPAAFDFADMEDVRFLVDHEGIPLGRSSAGTLTLEVDAKGLRYVATLPNTNRGAELYEAIRRGDVSQSSFAFIIEGENWTEEGGRLVRRVEAIRAVLDVSAVAFPAYAKTSVQTM